MKLSENISKSTVFVRKINAINLNSPKKLQKLKSDNKGRNKLKIGGGIDPNLNFMVVEVDYQFIYKKLACMIDLELICRIEFNEELKDMPQKKEINSLIDEVIPLFDKKIDQINELMDTNISTISKITSKSKSGNKDGN
jgi:hypothetical protein